MTIQVESGSIDEQVVKYSLFKLNKLQQLLILIEFVDTEYSSPLCLFIVNYVSFFIRYSTQKKRRETQEVRAISLLS